MSPRTGPAKPKSQKRPIDTRVILVRHARTPTTGAKLPGRTKGLHLSDEGKDQAARTAQRLFAAFKSIAAIYCSPLERTRETATPIAKAYGLKAITDKGLLECDFGDWTGANLKDLFKLPEWKRVQQLPSTFRFPNGESFLEMQARINDAIARLRSIHEGHTIVLVSHADPIKAAVASALGTPLDLFQRISISPCSLSVLQYGGASTQVLAINNVDSLGELQPS
jgi:probable phosphomutase (TIGR03848 family)